MQQPNDRHVLEVSLKDFIGFLKVARVGVKLGKRNIAREEAEFCFDGDKLTVTVVGVDHILPASGTWEGKVSIALPFIGGLRKAPPSQNPLTIGYVNSKLRIGTTAFPAKLTR